MVAFCSIGRPNDSDSFVVHVSCIKCGTLRFQTISNCVSEKEKVQCETRRESFNIIYCCIHLSSATIELGLGN